MKTFQEVTEGSEIDEKKMPADLKRKQQQKRKKWLALGKKHPDKVYARGYAKRLASTGHGAKDPKMGRKQGMKAQAGSFEPSGTMIDEPDIEVEEGYQEIMNLADLIKSETDQLVKAAKKGDMKTVMAIYRTIGNIIK